MSQSVFDRSVRTPDDAMARAWQGVRAAARLARDQRPRERTAFGLDATGSLRPVPLESHEAFLLWEPPHTWVPFPQVPPHLLPLLELYLPFCAAAPERPFVVGHLGQSIDGYIATASGDSDFVTGPDNILHLHRMRALCDAVIVGAETVATDNPRLTTRLAEGTNPVRVVLDPNRRLSADRKVFTDDQAETLLVCAQERADGGCGRAHVLGVPVDDAGLRLDALLGLLRARGLCSVLVEGGGATVSRFLDAGLLDRLHVAIAPIVTGRGRPGLRVAAQQRIADCLRPPHRVFGMGADVLFDCDLQAGRNEFNNSKGLRRIL